VRDGSEMVIEPVEHLGDQQGSWHEVPPVVDDVPFLGEGCAQETEHRHLGGLHGEEVVVAAVQHEHRDGDTWQEVDRFDLGLPALNLQPRDVQYDCAQTRLECRENAARYPPQLRP
jgi:hypothetical protein